MGKPADDPSYPTTPLEESSAAISLHTQDPDHISAAVPPPSDRYFDDDPTVLDNDDLPPLYSDHDNDARTGPIDPLLPADARSFPSVLEPFKYDKVTANQFYIDRRLDSDPVFLAQQLEHMALTPPRQFVNIRGTHTKSTSRSDGKSERREVVDFDVRLELTHLLYQDIHRQQPLYREISTASNFEKVRRGTVFATRAPGFGGSGGAVEEGMPTLEEWCRRFCASRAGLKCFTFERRVLGWDFDYLKGELETLVRDTNYRGTLKVDFPMYFGRVEIYNQCRTNRWRLTKWIEMIFVFTLMFLVAWPWIFFRTARWEVARADWYMSVLDAQGRKRYASVDEDRWYNMWARPIQRAVLARRQTALDQGDLNAVDEPRQEGLVGVVQAGVEAMGVVNRSFGWGADD